jgi:alpha-amylase
MAQGWPANYKGVMLQGFYWDSFDDSNWKILEKQADDLAASFSLIWIPQSGNCGGVSMGYDDLYWFSNYSSSFGNIDQLRSMIKTFKDKGLGTIADVVVNHRKNIGANGSWVDFPVETYNGETYEMLSTDICGNDDGGKTKTWAGQNGYTLGNSDTGEGWDGMRDLDHKSENVQRIVKAYLKFLLNDLGYAGFRYDMVKGYSASYTGMYNADSKPEFSVGEYFDGDAAKVRNWIDGTKDNGAVQSAAFDFPFRYAVRDAINQGWSKLGTPGIIATQDYRRYSVTFVENHDTEYRSSDAAQDPIRKDTLAANAFMLAMPGTPCVFLKHWQAYKPEIKAMIEARKLAGISNTSEYKRFFVGNPTQTSSAYYGNTVDDKLIVVVGNTSKAVPDASQWTEILSGYHYVYYLANTLETAWADHGSGDFAEAFDVVLTAVSATSGAKLVYTTDGSAPSASNGTQVETGTKVKIGKTTTLKVGLLIGSTVSGVITRQFTYKEPEPEPVIEIPSFCKVNEGEICAFFEAPTTWTDIYCWAWTNQPADNFTYANKNWPGVACTLLGEAKNGNQVWKWTWDGTKQNNSSATQPEQIIFNNNGSAKTADLDFKNGGYYTKNGLFDVVGPTGIRTVNADEQELMKVYTLDGQLVRTVKNGSGALSGLAKGVYIVNKKKFIVK